ncbi:PTS sugar transporter subunit IIA [Neobacillus citreus]|uniref:PTS EIIA type-4 domain-containing protein n=1 Tax=Neobacillus citreus TaxID=2833578 RepID=A0A942T2G8_9BACI|nr:hypothetical protein [Neobacillus citreus]MCH6267218.1 hypothetical protein [Neobacillus citreus]
MYQILVTGHGGFPSGVQSALRYLMGDNPNLSILALSEGMTHEQYEAELTEFLKNHPRLLVFADLTGGAPHQIAARILLENHFSPEQFLISGMPISVVTELTMKFQFQEVPKGEAPAVIQQTLAECKDMIHYLSLAGGV